MLLLFLPRTCGREILMSVNSSQDLENFILPFIFMSVYMMRRSKHFQMFEGAFRKFIVVGV